MYNRIITHDDFDGVVSSAICSYVFNIEDIRFAGPRTITESLITITEEDVVCDLPYPLRCGLWFDHHQGNEEELKYRGIDTDQLEGRFAPEPSCSRVVYEFFRESEELPVHFKEMVQEADIIDSFAYESIDDWRRETPGKVLERTLKLPSVSDGRRKNYMTDLVRQLRKCPLEEVARLPRVEELYRQYQEEEDRMIQQIHGDADFLPEDCDEELIVLDLTRHNRRPVVIKNLAYLIYPEAKGVVEVKNRFRRDVKTNDLNFSMSLSLNLNRVEHKKDVGEIMRLLNIGDGHSGAGAGVLHCQSKDEMLRRKGEVLKKIYQIWRNQ